MGGSRVFGPLAGKGARSLPGGEGSHALYAYGCRPTLLRKAASSVRGRVLATALAALCLSLTPALAVQPDEILKDPALERRARDISAGLRCLVCQNQSIDDSDAPLAKDLRVLVRERLKAGESDEAVCDFVVQRYGEFVLLKPTFGAHTALLWLGPALVLLTSATGIAFALRRRRAGQAVRALSAEERASLDAILGNDRASLKDY
jgi:cytochrome c-type biogenesis protein CcmH